MIPGLDRPIYYFITEFWKITLSQMSCHKDTFIQTIYPALFLAKWETVAAKKLQILKKCSRGWNVLENSKKNLGKA